MWDTVFTIILSLQVVKWCMHLRLLVIPCFHWNFNILNVQILVPNASKSLIIENIAFDDPFEVGSDHVSHGKSWTSMYGS